MCIEIVGLTDKGRVRDHNEDNLTIDKNLGLAVLADGMGGCLAGEVASKIAVETILEELADPLKKLPRHNKRNVHRGFHSATVLLEQAIVKANQLIYESSEQQAYYHGMGTTVVAALFHSDFVSIAHVGDSRLYRLRGNEFIQLTKDHSVRQELIDCGFYTPEQARHSPNKNLVTRALGVGQKVAVDIQEHSIVDQDIYLLCSDGLNDMLEDEEMHTLLTQRGPSLEQVARCLIEAANDKGGEDNISVVLVRPHRPSLKVKQSWWEKLGGWWH